MSKAIMMLRMYFKTTQWRNDQTADATREAKDWCPFIRWKWAPRHQLFYSLHLCNRSRTHNVKSLLVSSFSTITNNPSLLSTANQCLQITLELLCFTSRFMHTWPRKDRPSSFKHKGLTFVTQVYFFLTLRTHLSGRNNYPGTVNHWMVLSFN